MTKPPIPSGARPCHQPLNHPGRARPARPSTIWAGPPAGGWLPSVNSRTETSRKPVQQARANQQ